MDIGDRLEHAELWVEHLARTRARRLDEELDRLLVACGRAQVKSNGKKLLSMAHRGAEVT